MDFKEIITAVSSVGFPIVACFSCFWYIYKTGKDHKDEVKELATAINNNTIVMQKLVDHFGGGDNDIL